MGHSVRDVAARKLFTSTGRLSILSVLRRVKHSTVHVTKGQKKGEKYRVGKTDRRETADGLFTVDKRENKRPQLSRVTCMYTHKQTCN